MDFENRIEIVDKEGWRKEFVIPKRLVYIGSDPRNDIVLGPARGAGVAPRHLQLIASAGVSGGMGANAVNLSPTAIPLGDGGARLLEPNMAVEIGDGESLHLGEFILVVRLSGGSLPAYSPAQPAEPGRPMAAVAARAASIGLRVALAQPYLSPVAPLEGMIYVSNQGSAPGVQFSLSFEGLPPECCEIGPAPILFPGAEKGIPVRLTHPRRPGYPAGTQRLVFKAQAGESYPGEVATVAPEIRMLPFYHHTLRIYPAE